MPWKLTEITFEEAWPHPQFIQLEKNGWGTDDDVLESLAQLWPSILFAVVVLAFRHFFKHHLSRPIAKRFGVKSKNKIHKFGYQAWLMLAYTASTVYGMWALSDAPFFQWPIGNGEASVALWWPVPEPVSTGMWLYYWWGTGFYFAELLALFMEPKRSDFKEYVAHHVSTLLLLLLSTGCHYQRIGVIILLLHDVSDIFLCATKICHYLDIYAGVYIAFPLFTASFFYLRLYCYPYLIWSCFMMGPSLRALSYSWIITSHLLFSLQLLHIYWAVLIVKMVIRIAWGVRGDVRSDEDEEDAAINDKIRQQKQSSLVAPAKTGNSTADSSAVDKPPVQRHASARQNARKE